MAATGRSFVIAGAGIAGLSLALSLAKFGARVVVAERHRALQEFGAGLQIGPNARRILDRLGVGRGLSSTAFVPEALDIYPFRRESPAISVPLGACVAEAYGAPYAVMHRADLASALFQACKRFANIDVLFGVDAIHVATRTRGVTVIIEEADGRSQTLKPFAFVGADGVHSVTRMELLEGPSARYSGFTAWRALLPLDALGGMIAPDRTSVLCAPGYHAVLYPLTARERLNAVVVARAPAVPSDEADIPGAIGLPLSARRSRHFAALSQAGGDTWTRWPLYAAEAPAWHKGAIGLVGDAAHAMLPFQAQGAAMAIEDAAVLAPLLMTEEEAAAAFGHFERLRRARVGRVARTSAWNGRVFHMRFPLVLGRDTAFALGIGRHQMRRLDWLYRYDPTPEVATRPR